MAPSVGIEPTPQSFGDLHAPLHLLGMVDGERIELSLPQGDDFTDRLYDHAHPTENWCSVPRIARGSNAYKALALLFELTEHGADSRNQTYSLNFTKVALYHWSYTGELEQVREIESPT